MPVQHKQGEMIYVEFQPWQSDLQRVICCNKMLKKIYYNTKVFWEGLSDVKKLALKAGVSEDVAKLRLMKQVIWQIYFPAPKHILRPGF